MHYPSIVGANGQIAPENISLNGGWKPIDVNEPVGVSIHQDLGQVLVSTMPGHSWMIESDLRRGTFTLDGQPADGGALGKSGGRHCPGGSGPQRRSLVAVHLRTSSHIPQARTHDLRYTGA